MITHEILTEEGITIVRPAGPLSEDDFKGLATAVDAYLEDRDAMRGIVIHVKEFPGWENFSGFVQHMKFVKNHHQRVGKIALVTDSKLASVAPSLANHFVAAEVRGFEYEDLDGALEWVRSD